MTYASADLSTMRDSDRFGRPSGGLGDLASLVFRQFCGIFAGAQARWKCCDALARPAGLSVEPVCIYSLAGGRRNALPVRPYSCYLSHNMSARFRAACGPRGGRDRRSHMGITRSRDSTI